MLRAGDFIALPDDRVVWLNVILYDVLYLVGIELEPRTHVLGNVVGVERTLLNVAENWLYTVVARDDDIATVVACIEDIVVGILRFP